MMNLFLTRSEELLLVIRISLVRTM